MTTITFTNRRKRWIKHSVSKSFNAIPFKNVNDEPYVIYSLTLLLLPLVNIKVKIVSLYIHVYTEF